jgi:NAD(P)-dependent dehydrogenase (short-subunit alcohol dehydrogenase family)
VKQANRRVLIVDGDVRDTQFQEALVDRVIGEWGRLDILVNHSAFQWAHEPVAEDATELEQQLRTQTEGVFFLAKTAAAQMKPGSAIINTSVMRYRSSASQIRVHAAHEQAVTNLTVSLAHSLARAGIRVNAVEAGPVWTPRVLATLSADEIASFGSRTLLGRAAHPAEIAPAYVFIASREASYITGAVLPVTGGELSPEPLGPISRSDQS